jgi:hypothetical protein
MRYWPRAWTNLFAKNIRNGATIRSAEFAPLPVAIQLDLT